MPVLTVRKIEKPDEFMADLRSCIGDIAKTSNKRLGPMLAKIFYHIDSLDDKNPDMLRQLLLTLDEFDLQSYTSAVKTLAKGLFGYNIRWSDKKDAYTFSKFSQEKYDAIESNARREYLNTIESGGSWQKIAETMRKAAASKAFSGRKGKDPKEPVKETTNTYADDTAAIGNSLTRLKHEVLTGNLDAELYLRFENKLKALQEELAQELEAVLKRATSNLPDIQAPETASNDTTDTAPKAVANGALHDIDSDI